MTPKEGRLETPPDGDEGEIRDVEFDHVDERYESEFLGNLPKECQACSDPVDRTEPHVWAHGWQETPGGNVAHFRPVFCDRECWTEWASGGGE